nr:MAG TPA: hypothetical protein [Caudoviricetes sp.]
MGASSVKILRGQSSLILQDNALEGLLLCVQSEKQEAEQYGRVNAIAGNMRMCRYLH